MIAKKLAIGLPVALLLLLLICQPVMAGLRVEGAIIQDTVAAGDRRTYTFNVSDTAAEPMDVTIRVMGYGEKNGGLTPLAPDQDASPYSAREFLTVSPEAFHLEPGERRDVALTASVPADASGGRYAVVYVLQAPPGGGGAAAVAAVAIPVLLTIKDTELDRTGEIEKIEIVPGQSPGQVTVNARLTNTGNYHYKFSATATVRDTANNVLGTSDPVEANSSLIPGLSRLVAIPVTVTAEMPPGEYIAEVQVVTADGTIPITAGEVGVTLEPAPAGATESTRFQAGGTVTRKAATAAVPGGGFDWKIAGTIVGAAVGILLLVLIIIVIRKK
jgi:P pilus assembly chaperone PapD